VVHSIASAHTEAITAAAPTSSLAFYSRISQEYYVPSDHTALSHDPQSSAQALNTSQQLRRHDTQSSSTTATRLWLFSKAPSAALAAIGLHICMLRGTRNPRS
jgi:hypothetical protein